MYTIHKATCSICSPDSAEWQKAEAAQIKHINWKNFDCRISSSAKLLYDDDGIYVRMETDEKPLLSRQTQQNSRVCCDSCMEFFISPNSADSRYLNFEFNPFGTMHMSIRTSISEWVHPEENRDYFNVQSFVGEELWVLQFFIPFEFTDKIFGSHSKIMKGNFYKCKGDTENEHYISCFPINPKTPTFHCPEFFGEFILE